MQKTAGRSKRNEAFSRMQIQQRPLDKNKTVKQKYRITPPITDPSPDGSSPVSQRVCASRWHSIVPDG